MIRFPYVNLEQNTEMQVLILVFLPPLSILLTMPSVLLKCISLSCSVKISFHVSSFLCNSLVILRYRRYRYSLTKIDFKFLFPLLTPLITLHCLSCYLVLFVMNKKRSKILSSLNSLKVTNSLVSALYIMYKSRSMLTNFMFFDLFLC